MLNATAAAALADSYGIPAETIAQALRGFLSVKRRLEVRAEIGGITIIDDFAHHPTAIRATLGALRKRYAGRRLWAILEPRSNTLRRNVFQQELVESLALADRGCDRQCLFQNHGRAQAGGTAGCGQCGRRTQCTRRGGGSNFPMSQAIVSSVVPKLVAGDVVAILSNGGFGGIYEKLPAALQLRAGEVMRKLNRWLLDRMALFSCGHLSGAGALLLVSCRGCYLWRLSEARRRARCARGCGDPPTCGGVPTSGMECALPDSQFRGEREPRQGL